MKLYSSSLCIHNLILTVRHGIQSSQIKIWQLQETQHYFMDCNASLPYIHVLTRLYLHSVPFILSKIYFQIVELLEHR